jgi:2-keto-4-pentenoate hydratase/2-oxohepta-3-ene-1,7-dioic acid hydratase in catechol pathway
MKLLTFVADGRERIGAYHDGLVIDLYEAAALGGMVPQETWRSLKALLAAEEEGLRWAGTALRVAIEQDEVGRAGLAWPLADVQLRPPIPDPSKILAIGLNYRDHCVEQNLPEPKVITLFAKFPSALCGAGAPIVLPPREVCAQVDYEAELAVVIGRGGSDIPEDEAYEHVAGYTCCNDVSGRDVQYGDGGRQWVHGKSFDTFCPLGPWLVTRDEVPDPHDLAISCTVSGEKRQSSHTGQLVFRIPYLISELSKSLTLQPGDVLTTGTPGGVGVYSSPQRFLQAGDEVVVRIEGIGELRNPVVAG